jgi:hypothetical protein
MKLPEEYMYNIINLSFKLKPQNIPNTLYSFLQGSKKTLKEF